MSIKITTEYIVCMHSTTTRKQQTEQSLAVAKVSARQQCVHE